METSSPISSPATSAAARWLAPVLGLLFVVWLSILPCSLVVYHGFDRRWGWSCSLVLAVAAWLHWAGRRRGELGRFALGIAVGMTLGCIADYRSGLMLKIVLFALGHVAYIAGCVSAGGRLGLGRRAVWGRALLGWLLVGALLWWWVASGAPQVGPYRWPSLVYTLLLASTAGTMTALAVQERRFALMAVGAALFLASDAALATRVFYEPALLPSSAVWFTYGPGQMLIVFGAALATARLAPKRVSGP